MGALSLPPFTPADTLPPLRLGDDIDPARMTTSDEQRAEALRHIAAECVRTHAKAATLEVRWTRGTPTVLEVSGHFEHLPTAAGVVAVYCPDEIAEHTLSGVAVQHDEAERLRRLRAELAEMSARDAGPA